MPVEDPSADILIPSNDMSITGICFKWMRFRREEARLNGFLFKKGQY